MRIWKRSFELLCMFNLIAMGKIQLGDTMADNMSKEQRSYTMSRIKSKSKLEDIFASMLWRKGLRFRRNVKTLKGKPDIAIAKYKVVIFVDSCFWHVCPLHFIQPKSNKDYWDKKLKRNQERDLEK
ncbi:very short patch repair endonuclease [Sporosarcina koreensis]|uniref:Very short patch repair endonuclease n=1 Tax=Sporosarcina koreensis TaxID=334735 RepID=A0ABW0TVR8_9BACL